MAWRHGIRFGFGSDPRRVRQAFSDHVTAGGYPRSAFGRCFLAFAVKAEQRRGLIEVAGAEHWRVEPHLFRFAHQVGPQARRMVGVEAQVDGFGGYSVVGGIGPEPKGPIR